jgi:hypothetical protein
MTQSYLVSMYLNCPPNAGIHCPNASQLADFHEAVQNKWITWHAFPHNAELELMDQNSLSFALRLTHDLDDYFGLPHKATLSQRDVPGTTVATLPLLAAQGIRAISVGVNGASTFPNVPRGFLWNHAPSNTTLWAMWHPRGYGGIDVSDAVILPGTSHALVFAWRGDNAGPPQSVDEVLQNFATVRQEFPGAAVIPSTFDEFVSVLGDPASAPAGIPTLSSEIGDTWIHGVASDPLKLAQMRTIQRLRTACEATAQCSFDDPRYYNFSRLFLKNAEHTWGLDVKTYLHDVLHWSNVDLRKQLAQRAPNFVAMVDEWNAQRQLGIGMAVEALADHPLAADIQGAFAELQPTKPSTTGFQPLTAGKSLTCGGGRFVLSFDAATGAMSHLQDMLTGTVWADAAHPWLLQQYRTYVGKDFDNFIDAYIVDQPPPSWASLDFGKPNMDIARPKNQTVSPSLKSLWLQPSDDGSCSILVQTAWAADLVSQYGAAADTWTVVNIARDTITVDLLVFGKTATRLGEAMFLSVVPAATGGSWAVSKLGATIPADDVASGGARRLHAVDSGVSYSVTSTSGQNEFSLLTIDAPLLAFGAPDAFPVPTNAYPDFGDAGVHVCLWDNLWGTNYIMWYPFNAADADMRFRFAVTFS